MRTKWAPPKRIDSNLSFLRVTIMETTVSGENLDLNLEVGGFARLERRRLAPFTTGREAFARRNGRRLQPEAGDTGERRRRGTTLFPEPEVRERLRPAELDLLAAVCGG